MPRLWHDRKCTPAATATRKPLLSFRLSGLFLLRLAERQFHGLLFQDPPRSTRRLNSPDPLGLRTPEAANLAANRGFAPVPQEG
jgi:hypothetical protein